MRHAILIFAVLMLLALACNLTSPADQIAPPTGDEPPPRQTASPLPASPCGDGICQGPENARNCPEDCGEPPQEAPTSTVRQDAPLFLTTMTHMEGDWPDDTDQDFFLRNVQRLRFGMDLFEDYGAKMTVESEKPFSRANTVWDLNILQEVVRRGHGVGTHCDIGFRDPIMPAEEFAALLKENKDLVDALVGAENNRGCSGAGGANDWAVAARMAGFDYIDGIVGMHYLSMPIANRPDPSWTDQYIRNVAFHYNAPVELEQRLYPFLIKDATDFIPDPDGTLLVSGGDLGQLAGLAEAEQDVICRPDCSLADEDVEALLRIIDEVDRTRDRSRIAKLNLYFPANIFVETNESSLRHFLSQMEELERQGIIQWATQLEVAEAVFSWNSP